MKIKEKIRFRLLPYVKEPLVSTVRILVHKTEHFSLSYFFTFYRKGSCFVRFHGAS